MEITKEILAIDKMIMKFDDIEIMEKFISLDEKLFKDELNRKCFKLIKSGYKKKRHINEILSYDEELSKLLFEIMDNVKVSVYSEENIIQGLKDIHYKNLFEATLRKSISNIHENDLTESINQTMKEILSISKESDMQEEEYIFDNKKIAENFYSKYENEDRKKPLMSNIKDLDYLIKFHKKEIYTISARPGSGKTAFCLALLKNFCKNKNFGVFYSLEMSEEQLANRIIASISGVNLNYIENGDFLKNEEMDLRVQKAISFLTTDLLSFKIIDKAGMRIEDIIGTTKKINKEKKVDFIMIDHVGLIRPSNREEKRVMIDNAYKEFKRIAKDLNVPVFVLAQLNRGIEHQAEAIPVLSHLKDSGSIEEDSAGVIMLNNPMTSLKDEEKKKGKENLLEAYVRKNRFGKLGKCDLYYDMSTQYIGDAKK